MKILSGELAGYEVQGKVEKGGSVKVLSPRNSVPYVVTINEDGGIVCTCTGYTYRGACKHTKYVSGILGESRMSRAEAEAIIKEVFGVIGKALDWYLLAGSYRRGRQTLKDIDVVATGDAILVKDLAEKGKVIDQLVMSGEHLLRFRYKGLLFDFLFVEESQRGAALMYRTGPRELNIKQRSEAKARGYKLNEFGLWKDGQVVAGATEEEVYAAMGWKYLTPEEREQLYASKPSQNVHISNTPKVGRREQIIKSISPKELL